MTGTIEYTHAFQPIVDIDSEEVVSYEVLLRGKNNEPPDVIFDRMAGQGLMDFDQASRERAIRLAVRCGVECSLNLNFTPGSVLFEDGRYVTDTIAAARSEGVRAEQLVLEITESEAINTSDDFMRVLDMMRRAGVTIAIDDFGSGYAGLNLLADVQPDWIKLDMHLLKGIERNGARQSIVRAISHVCLDLGIDVLAEGVETEGEFAFLRKLGISLYQGFLFARPGFECLPDVSNLDLRR